MSTTRTMWVESPSTESNNKKANENKRNGKLLEWRQSAWVYQPAFMQLKTKKAPWPDWITNEMLTHFSNTSMCMLLDIYSHIWTQGLIPQMEISIHYSHPQERNGSMESCKLPSHSLTSCVWKNTDRIVNALLKWYMETNNILETQQACFRQFRSTKDKTSYLSQETEYSFQEQKAVLTAWIDMRRVFDKVWTDEEWSCRSYASMHQVIQLECAS